MTESKHRTAYLQDLGELEKFISLLREEGVRSFLEIGSKFGGSLWRIATSLPTGSRVVSVDLPQGDGSFKATRPHLEACVAELKNTFGYDVHAFYGDSTSDHIVASVRDLGPYDACFIDANHTEPYVRKDWANYGPMCRMVAFHDVGWIERVAPGKKPIEVPKVWNEIKRDFRHTEIRMCPRDNGIGVLWR